MSQGRTPWAARGFGLIVVFILTLGAQAAFIKQIHRQVRASHAVSADLRSLLDGPSAQRAVDRCGPVFVPSYGLRATVAYLTEQRIDQVIPALNPPTADGLFLKAAGRRVMGEIVTYARSEARWLGLPLSLSANPLLQAPVPATYRKVASNSSWALYAGCKAR